MAARRKRSATRAITVTRSSPAPIIVQTSRPAPVARRRRARRSRGGAVGGTNTLAADAISGAAYGLVERVTADLELPEVPVIGRKGVLALGLYLLRGTHPIVAQAARAGVIISSYELVKEGKISGDDDL